MKHYSKLFKRAQAWVLTIAMLVPILNSGFVLGVGAKDSPSKTPGTTPGRLTIYEVGKIVAENYDDLSNEEKALISSGVLEGDYSIGMDVPSDGDDLVEVDLTEKVLRAKTYVYRYGNVDYHWVPVSAKLSGRKVVDVTFAGDPKDGVFVEKLDKHLEKLGDAFSVKVTYKFYVDVDAELQSDMLQAAAYLKQGLANLAAVDAQYEGLKIWELAMPELVNIVNNGIPTPIGSATFADDVKAAVSVLDAQMDANGGKLNLSVLLNEYRAGSKTECLIKKGATVQREALELAGNIAAINVALTTMVDNLTLFIQMGAVDQATADRLTMLAGQAKEIVDGLAVVNAEENQDTWYAANNKVVKADTDYAKLDAMVNAIGNITAVPTIKNPLYVDETVVQYNMAMFNVEVRVILNTVCDDADSSDYNKEVEYGRVNTRLTLKDGSTLADIQKALNESGIVGSALKKWEEEGAYAVEHFGSVASLDQVAIDEIRQNADYDEDVTYSIVYSPKKYSVTLDGSSMGNFSYGYTYPLEKFGNVHTVYDYVVNGQKYYEGDTVRILGETVITRTEGKRYMTYTMGQLVGEAFFPGDEKAMNILASGALSVGSEQIKIRVPDATDVRVQVTEGHVLKAPVYTADYPLRAEGSELLKWVPTSFVLVLNDGTRTPAFDMNGTEFDLATLTGWGQYGESYTEAIVTYELDLSDEISEEDLATLVDIPGALSADVASQLDALDRLGSVDFASLPLSMLSTLNTLLGAEGFGSYLTQHERDELRNIIAGITADCMAEGKLKLVTMIENMGDEKLIYYYKHPEMKDQLDILAVYLDRLVAVQGALIKVANNEGFGEYVEKLNKIGELQEKVTDIRDDLKKPSEYINANAEMVYMQKLVAALMSGGTISNVEFENGQDAQFTLKKEFSAISPNRVRPNVTLTVGSQNISLNLPTYALGQNMNADVAKAIADEVNAKIAEMIVEADRFFYEIPNIEEVISAAWNGEENKAVKEFTVAINCPVKEFEVVIPAIDAESKTETTRTEIISIEDMSISLTPSKLDGIECRYIINGKTFTVVKTEEYGFTKDEIRNGQYSISRDIINHVEDDLKELVDSLNNNNSVEFILTKTGAEGAIVGEYAIVMKVNASAMSEITGAMVGMATGLVTSSYEYIALGDRETAFIDTNNGQKQIYLQTMMDAINFSTEMLVETLNADGSVNHITMPEDTLVWNASAGKYVNGANALGGQMIRSDMYVGARANNARELDFYITIDQVAADSELAQLRNLFADFLGNYMVISYEGGVSSITFNNLPDKVFQAFLAAMLMTGDLDIRDIRTPANAEKVNARFAVSLVKDFIDPLFQEADLSIVQNTFNMFGFIGEDVDLSQYSKAFDMIRNQYPSDDAIQYLIETPDDDTASIIKEISIDRIVSAANQDEIEAFLSLIHEETIEIGGQASVVGFTAKCEGYNAIYADLAATSKIDMFGMTANIVGKLPTMSGISMVVLLNDVEGDLKINSGATTVLNLNGFTVNGDIDSDGNLTIVNSALDETGGVTGTISGNVSILAGHYEKDVRAFLKDGYVQVDGVVRNEFYNFVEDEAGNLNIEIEAGLYDTDFVPNVKALVLDLAVDVLFNNFSTNSMFLEDYKVFHFVVNDFVNIFAGVNRGETLQALLENDKPGSVSGLASIINMIENDLTNFEALAFAIENRAPVASYKLTTGSWDLRHYVPEDEDYLTVGIMTGNEKERQLNIKIVGENDEQLNNVADVFGVLADVADVENKITMDTMAADSNLTFKGGISTDIRINFAKDNRYAILFSIILANGMGESARQDLVNGIKSYYQTGSMAALKNAFDNVTVGQALTALESAGDTMENMLTKLELTDAVGNSMDIFKNDTLNKYARVLAMGIRKLDAFQAEIDGLPIPDPMESGRKIGSFYVNSNSVKGYGRSYTFSDKSFSRDLFKGYSATLTASVHMSAYVKMFDFAPDINENAILEAIRTEGSKFYNLVAYFEMSIDSQGNDNVILDARADGLTVSDFLELIKLGLGESTKDGALKGFTVYKDADTYGQYDKDGRLTGCSEDWAENVLIGTGFNVLVHTAGSGNDGHTNMVTVLGDVNGDGRSGSNDAFDIQNRFLGNAADLTEYQISAMNILRDANDRIDSADAYEIMRKYLYWSVYKEQANA